MRSSKVLEYYKKEGGELKGVINLEDCVSIHSALYHKKYKFVFDIKTKDRIYYLVAATAEEMMSWVEAVCELCSFSSPNRLREWGDCVCTPVGCLCLLYTVCYSTALPNATTTYVPNESIPKLVEQGASLGPVKFPIRQDSCPILSAEVCSEQEGAVAGMPLTQALISKGLASSATATGTPDRNSVFAPHPTDQKGYLHDALSQMYDTPSNNTLAPQMQHGSFATISSPDPSENYSKPRSWTTVDPSICSTANSDRAHTLANGYMVPRLNPPQQRVSNYDYPPPPRPANTVTITQPNTANPGMPLDFPTARDYVNYQPQPEILPPPIDRTTKPCPPRIDRSTKPDRRNSTGQLGMINSPPREIPRMSPLHSESSRISQASSLSSELEEPFLAADIPRPVVQSVQYTQVTFKHKAGIGQLAELSDESSTDQQASKKPVPAPRNKTSTHYTKIDLAATSALRFPDPIEESSSESDDNYEDGYLKMTGDLDEDREKQDNNYTHFFPSPAKVS